jgi:hypothetical protein
MAWFALGRPVSSRSLAFALFGVLRDCLTFDVKLVGSVVHVRSST